MFTKIMIFFLTKYVFKKHTNKVIDSTGKKIHFTQRKTKYFLKRKTSFFFD